MYIYYNYTLVLIAAYFIHCS